MQMAAMINYAYTLFETDNHTNGPKAKLRVIYHGP